MMINDAKVTSAELKEGLPDIAQSHDKKKIIFLAALGGILAISFLAYTYYPKKPKSMMPQIEETYAVPVTVTSPLPSNQPLQIKAPRTESVLDSKPELTQQQQALLQQLMLEKQKELHERLNAPLLQVNEASSVGTSTLPASMVTGNNVNSQFMNQVSQVQPDTVNATLLGSLSYLITEGTLIDATLESAADTDLPGYLRASVSQPVYSDDGTRLLIPSGSRLIGQYKSDMVQGQNRIFVVWTRLILPNRISINLGSPGVDPLGVTGMKADAIKHHFFANFGSAILRSVIVAGASNIGVSRKDEYNAKQAYRMGIANSIADSSNESLDVGTIAPTLYKDQGAAIKVFVAHDLNLQPAMQLQAYLKAYKR